MTHYKAIPRSTLDKRAVKNPIWKLHNLYCHTRQANQTWHDMMSNENDMNENLLKTKLNLPKTKVYSTMFNLYQSSGFLSRLHKFDEIFHLIWWLHSKFQVKRNTSETFLWSSLNFDEEFKILVAQIYLSQNPNSASFLFSFQDVSNKLNIIFSRKKNYSK